ncbi:MAG TPA: trypsin-like peptidase domain-containing protein, partial [Tepidisphaeraceae bacterium]
STGRGNNAEIDKAVESLETAVKLRPDSPEALSNLAIGYVFKKRWEDSVMMAYKAVKKEDSQELAENLVNVLVAAPDGMKSNNKKVKPIIEEAVILAQKYNIPATGTRQFHYLPPKAPSKEKDAPGGDKDEDKGPPGVIGNGSGFVVSADGYILTNRHVAEGKNRLFRVRFDDGTEKSAEVVAIDTQYDIAMLKIKADHPLAFLKISPADLPKSASKCLVLGYPVADILHFQMQVTSGEINSTTSDPGEKYQVTLSANTTHGNSGGPIVDRDCNVIGVLSAGLEIYNATYIKALSAGQIRGFLDRIRDKYTASIDPGKATETQFDAEKLADQARKATLLVLIIRGDGKESATEAAKIPSSQPAEDK